MMSYLHLILSTAATQPVIMDRIIYPSEIMLAVTANCPPGRLEFAVGKHPANGTRPLRVSVGETEFGDGQLARLHAILGDRTINYVAVRDCGADGDERIRIWVSLVASPMRTPQDASVLTFFDIRGHDIVPAP